MKTLMIAITFISALGSPVMAQSIVSGYTRSNGTTVSPYIRSAPNGTTADNYGRRN